MSTKYRIKDFISIHYANQGLFCTLGENRIYISCRKNASFIYQLVLYSMESGLGQFE